MTRRTEGDAGLTAEYKGRNFVLIVTLCLVAVSLLASFWFVVHSAWIHDLRRGAFALLFSVMSAKLGLNWLQWREEDLGSYRDPST